MGFFFLVLLPWDLVEAFYNVCLEFFKFRIALLKTMKRHFFFSFDDLSFFALPIITPRTAPRTIVRINEDGHFCLVLYLSYKAFNISFLELKLAIATPNLFRAKVGSQHPQSPACNR